MKDWVRGKVVGKRTWTEGLCSLQLDAPVADFRAGQYIQVALDVEGERIGRHYSLVNPPQERPLELLFNEVTSGALTTNLSNLVPGDSVRVSARAGGHFTLETVLPAANLWLLATGTGLGVFLSMLRTPDPWERFGRVILVHGVRFGADLVYPETIASIGATHTGRFTYIPVVSRESWPMALSGRITTLLASGILEDQAGARIGPECSHVMLCGNSAMIKDAKRILEGHGLMRHRPDAPGQYSAEHYH
jgi:ferredoxin--NADP+ reductase